jgi:hypothetical protein
MSLVSHSTTTIVEMDAASKALAEAPPDDDRTWAVRADSSGIALTTLYNRHRGRPSKEEIGQRQQYLTVEEEKALVAFLLLTVRRAWIHLFRSCNTLILKARQSQSASSFRYLLGL